MRSKKYSTSWILLFSLLLCSLAGCTKDVEVNEEDVYYPECTEQELINAIDSANTKLGPGEIHLPPNCEYQLTQVDNTQSLPPNPDVRSGLPMIIDELTIYGNNSVIDIQPASDQMPFGHFFLDGKKLKLYDLSLVNGNRPWGGSVFNHGGELRVYNTRFINNRAYQEGINTSGLGGAIYSKNGVVRIYANSLFEGNLAGDSLEGAPNNGGAVYSLNSSLIINDSSFMDNYAAGDGGAVYAANLLSTSGNVITVQLSDFSENRSSQHGGAFYISNKVDGAYIVTSSFIGNTSGERGGAIFSADSDIDLDICNFHSNQAEHGGAVFTSRTAEGVTSRLDSVNSEYRSNAATGNGGAIFSANSDLELEGAVIMFNQASGCGGIQLGGVPGMDVPGGALALIPRVQSISDISSSTISTNEALTDPGGGLCHWMGDLVIRDTTIGGNSTPSYGGGMITADTLHVIDSEILGNTAERGGGLTVGFPLDDANYVSPVYLDSTIRIEESRISSNLVQDSGGGIWVHHAGSLIIQKSTIGNNTANQEGGGIYLEEGGLFVDNSTIAENTAWRGGGVYTVGADSVFRLLHTTVAYNTANDSGNELRSGGGGLNINGTVYITSSLVVLNDNNDCDPNQGLSGDYGIECDGYCLKTLNNIDSDGTCNFDFQPEPYPLITPFNGHYSLIFPGSPLIDRVVCYLSDDQIGTTRPRGSSCEPGSIEFDSFYPPPPPPVPSSGENEKCDPFARMEISVNLLGINPETMTLPVYLGFSQALPDLGEGTMLYRGTLGDLDSFLCNQQGFPDRLYCMFSLQPNYPGTIRDLNFYKEDCPNPVFAQPGLTIPDMPGDDQPGPSCNEDLGEDACEAAGGIWPDIDKPTCQCP